MENTREFASMAEAVAHYYDEGFYSLARGSDRRVMSRQEGKDWVVIRQTGFLKVEANETIAESQI